MGFLKTLFNRSINTNRRSLSKRSKTLSLESLEQRIALDASGVRPQLEAVREVHIDNSLVGPDPMVFGKSELVGHGTKSFVITAVAAGSTVEKWDAATNQWRDVSTPPTSSNPRQLLQLLQNRIIQKDDQVRWIPKSTDGLTQKAFEIIGWDDGSEASEPEGVNVPGAVENLEIELVGDEVRVTWDPPTTGAAVTHYRIHQNPTTVVPSTQTSHTFAKVASPASYAVTVHANGTEGAGEATTVTLSHASYVKNDGTVVDPILDTAGKVLNYDGPNLKPNSFRTKYTDANLKNSLLLDADLSNMFLLRANLTGADLTNANLTGAILNRSTLTNANLINTNLTGANLIGADLTNVTLTNANLTSADLLKTNLTGANLIGAILNRSTLPNANLINTNLTGANLIGADLTNVTLTNANLASVSLSTANLNGANLTGANLNGADLTNVKSGSITGDGGTKLPTNWQLINGYLIGPSADLSGANLSGADLAFDNLANATLTGANLTGATLTGADLDGANLYGADLTNVKSGSILNFYGTQPTLPTNWQLINGYLIGPSADLSGANLSGADLSGADLTNVKSGGITVTGTPPTLPADWQLIDGYLIGPTANLTGANLTGANLTSADLTTAILTNVKSGGITFDGTPPPLPTDWQLIDGYLIGPTANLSGADLAFDNLTNANLNGANLTGANLNGADLDGANLYGADLTNVKSGSILNFYGTQPTLPTNWQLINGYLIGPSADLSGANLSGADLAFDNLANANLYGANLTGATLTGVDLTNANLVGVRSGGITVTGTPPTLPTDWQLIDGYLIGPGADLVDANLTHQDLTGASLRWVTGVRMHLDHAILANTDLRWANLTDATLTNVSGAAKYNSATILPHGFDPVAAGWTLVS